MDRKKIIGFVPSAPTPSKDIANQDRFVQGQVSALETLIAVAWAFALTPRQIKRALNSVEKTLTSEELTQKLTLSEGNDFTLGYRDILFKLLQRR